MNALKNVLFFGLLAAVLFGVYVSLKQQPEQPIPKGLSDDISTPKIEVPGMDGAPPPAGNSAAGNGGGLPSQPPMAAPPAGGMAPAAPYPQAATASGSSVAPSYTPPDQAASQSLPPPPADSPSLATLPPPPGANYPTGVTDPSAVGNLSPPPAASGPVMSENNRGAPAAPPWPPSTNPSAPPPAENSAMASLDLIMQQVKINVDQQNYAKALEVLSGIYDNPDLPASRAKAITEVLDQLAAKVIYSREHLLEPVYGVQPGDTLDTIADHYKVPPLLLARINGIRDPQNLPPGKQLKVLKGPFSAFVSVERGELTLKLEGRYAGRFPLALSTDLQRAAGLYTVRGKSSPPATGRAPQQWIELNNPNGTIGIEAAADTTSAAHEGHSTIWLARQDMDDVYGILSVGSRVVIHR